MNSKINGGKGLPAGLFRRDGSARTAGAISVSAGGYAIADTSTTAKVGDIYRAETATTSVMQYKEYPIIEASANSFTIASKDLPVLGDTFYVLGRVTERLDNTGAIQASIDTSLLATAAKQDTQITSLQLLDDVVATTGSAILTKGFQVSGTDGTNARILKTDTSGELQVDVLSSALPSGAATSALQSTIDASINTLLKPANTLAAVTTVTTVSSVTAIANALPAGNNNIGDVDVASIAAGDNNIGNVDVVTLPALVAGSAVIGKVGIDQTTPGTTNLVALAANQSVNVAQINGVTTLMGAGSDGTGSQRITHSSGATGTLANVNDTASSTTLLAASTSRLGATFFNDSITSLYLKFGATASTTSFTVLIAPQGYYELPGPHIYNGIIDGIWSADASGAVRVTSW